MKGQNMRIPIIAGNWKMHKNVSESAEFAIALVPKLAEFTGVERVVAPTFLSLAAVADVLIDTDISVSAQDAHWEDSGAYTSEVSASMLKDIVRSSF